MMMMMNDDDDPMEEENYQDHQAQEECVVWDKDAVDAMANAGGGVDIR